MKKVHVIGGDQLIERMFENRGWTVVSHPDQGDLLQFTGGSDVSPILYRQLQHPQTTCHLLRDMNEAQIFLKYEGIKPMAGICRGAQFLHVMNGGTLFQDVDNHTRPHKIDVPQNEETIEVTSTHHQMMRVDLIVLTDKVLDLKQINSLVNPNFSGEIIGFSQYSQRKEYMERDKIKRERHNYINIDIEILKYPKCLCFQPHPEYPFKNNDMQDLYFDLLNNIMEVK